MSQFKRRLPHACLSAESRAKVPKRMIRCLLWEIPSPPWPKQRGGREHKKMINLLHRSMVFLYGKFKPNQWKSPLLYGKSELNQWNSSRPVSRRSTTKPHQSRLAPATPSYTVLCRIQPASKHRHIEPLSGKRTVPAGRQRASRHPRL